MTATGKVTNDNTAGCEVLSGDGNEGSTVRRIVQSLIAINAVALISLTGLLYFDREAPNGTSVPLNRLRWWSQPWGEYVPFVVSKADTDASQWAVMLGSLFACLTLVLALAATIFGRGRERYFLSTFGLVLAVGWVLIGTTWGSIRLSGRSAELVQYAESVGEFAKRLDASWPDQGGEIPDFGAFLAYPYGEPRTLLMLGDARIPNTSLRVAAVERTPGQAIRFQLVGDAADIWFERRATNTIPTKFRGGLQQNHTPTNYIEIAANTFIVKYSIAAAERVGELSRRKPPESADEEVPR